MTNPARTVSRGRRPGPAPPGGLTEEERKLYEQIPARVEYVYHPTFCRPEAEGCFFGSGCLEINVPDWRFPSEVPERTGAERRGAATLSPEEEATLFLRYNYARFRLHRLLPRSGSRISLPRARQMLLWYKRAMKARADLVRANMGLVLAMAKRSRTLSVELGELASEGYLALLRSIEKFDVSRGFKFSTYACRAILKSFHRLAAKAGRYRQHFPVEFDVELQHVDSTAVKHDEQWEDSIGAVRQILSQNLASLTEMERRVLTHRFALASGGDGLTLADIGERVGFSNERVRQILNGALRKLRTSLYRQFLPS